MASWYSTPTTLLTANKVLELFCTIPNNTWMPIFIHDAMFCTWQPRHICQVHGAFTFFRRRLTTTTENPPMATPALLAYVDILATIC